MTDHTPTPWVQFEIDGKCDSIMPAGRDGDICTFRTSPSDSDAAFIVKACNNHDALVKALQETSAILMATVTAGRLSECDDFSFTGEWKRLGRIRLGQVLDGADAALQLAQVQP